MDQEDNVPYTGVESEQIQNLARSLSRQSGTEVDGQKHTFGELMQTVSNTGSSFRDPFHDNIEDTELDPNSDHFDSKAWTRNMYRLFQADPERYQDRELGYSYKNLAVHGYGSGADYQLNVLNVLFKLGSLARSAFSGFKKNNRVDILHSMDGVIRPGELVVVLGRPGAGCSTFLKTAAVQTYGFYIDEKTELNYHGVKPREIERHFRGDVVYCAESEIHFPHLTVGDTLLFAAKMRTPENRIPGVTRLQHATYMRDVIMATFGLSHTLNTKVGNDVVRGVSGGERKRVSIAEVALSGAPLQCWDNSTRGLDSATALEFIRSLKVSADVFNTASLVAVYQSSEEMYSLFDKVVLLYEGYQIFFGEIYAAKQFFYEMGFEPRPRQPTPDFLTSLSQPSERVVRAGYEDKVPRTPQEFEQRWKNSDLYRAVVDDVDQYNCDHVIHGEHYERFKDTHRARQSRSLPHQSSYVVSYGLQVKYLIERGYRRILGDFSFQFTSVFGNSAFGLVLASVFYNLPANTGSFYSRSALLFFAILFNAFSSLLELFSLYEARPIILKHKQYAMYDPTADAFASILTEMPSKIFMAIAFNIIIYFMANLRRDAGHFFVFMLNGFFATISMSHLFRTVGAFTTSLAEAMTPATVLLFALIIYTGFVIPVKDMLGWSRWINYLNPVGYAFETLMVNEFHDRDFECSSYVPSGPGYDDVSRANQVCSGTGAVPGQNFINGDQYLGLSFGYTNAHKWRNFGIVIGFCIFFLFTYIFGVWVNPGLRSKGEVLVFQRDTLRKLKKEQKILARASADVESQGSVVKDNFMESEKSGIVTPLNAEATAAGPKVALERSEDIFFWKDVCFDVKVKGGERRLLDHIDGWVKPGTLTALMGASGAGKTTLLDTLANRVTTGVVTGEMLVNGIPRDDSFQRSTGYAQQQDLHLPTSTVREALTFSALLRQPKSVPKKEKIAYVDTVLQILEMEAYADAVVGVPGEGLNVEQRKRLTIGVELVAKPKLLLFLDEPTSGLDSQTAWSVCQLMKKLSDAGQAILCTIHQPSALLLQEFDRLLFLARGGRTVYFGAIGHNSKELTGYFERHGADPCPPDANPAEWMLHVIGAAPGSVAKHDYAQVWSESEERAAVRGEIEQLKIACEQKRQADVSGGVVANPEDERQFAADLWLQYLIVTKRVFEQLWRSPSYIWAKIFLSVFAALFNGFSFFHADQSLQGLQDLMFSVFMFLNILNSSIQQLIPFFVTQRELYEARERPSKIFSWKAFIAAQITGELPWQILVATLSFFCWYYPIGLYKNARLTDAQTARGGLMYFYILLFSIYISTFGQMLIAGMDLGDTAANVGSLLFTMALIFCGALATKEALPGFWIFMYRVSPFTYFISGVLTVALADSPVVCSPTELVNIVPPAGLTCGEYLGTFANATSGLVHNPLATDLCSYCTTTTTNTFLASIDANFAYRWRNLGIFFCYIAFHVIMTFVFYWLARVPKQKTRVKNKKE